MKCSEWLHGMLIKIIEIFIMGRDIVRGPQTLGISWWGLGLRRRASWAASQSHIVGVVDLQVPAVHHHDPSHAQPGQRRVLCVVPESKHRSTPRWPCGSTLPKRKITKGTGICSLTAGVLGFLGCPSRFPEPGPSVPSRYGCRWKP